MKAFNRVALLSALVLLSTASYAQVGIGTSTPNTHSVLELKSASNNKGVLVPRLTTAQRQAIAGLTATENGLLVFDSDIKEFFYWNTNAWIQVNKPQDLVLTGSTLTISDNPNATPVLLSAFTGTNSDDQNISYNASTGQFTITRLSGNQSISLTGTSPGGSAGGDLSGTYPNPAVANNAITTAKIADGAVGTADLANAAVTDTKVASGIAVSKLSPSATNGQVLTTVGGATVWATDGDGSATNEIQNLSSTSTGTNRTINISGGTGTTIDVADNDNSVTNEIQDLSLASNVLSLTGDATTVNLAPYLDNTDAQNLSSTSTGTNRTINITGGTGTTIDVADNDNSTTNEIQTLTLTGANLAISSGNSVSLSAINTDNQDLSLSGNTLSLTGDATTVSLATFLDNTDAQTLSLTGLTLAISGGNSLSLSAVNTDNQDLSLASNILSLTGDATTVSLAAYLDNTDAQNLSNTVSGTNRTINITGGTGTTIDVADNDNSVTNEIQDLSLASNILSLTGDATTVSLAAYLDNTDAQNLSNTVSGTNRTINITGGTGTTIDVADNDNNSTNEIQTLSLTGSTLSISSGNAVTISGLAPGGAAGGDLNGSYPNPTVDGLRGTPVSTTAPTTGQVLKYDGTNWAPGTDNSGGGGITGGGANGQVTYWTGASSINGDAGLQYDNKNAALGINIAPQGTLHVNGSQFVRSTIMDLAKTGNYTVGKADYYLGFLASGSQQVTLPPVASNVGRILIIRAFSIEGFDLVVNDPKNERIEGAVGIKLAQNAGKDYYSVTLIAVSSTEFSPATRWFIIDYQK